MKKKVPSNSIFKSYLKPSNLYIGGKSRKEVDSGGKKIYKLSSNENLLGSSPKAIQAIKDHINSLSEYPDRVDKRLQAALSDFYKQELKVGQFLTANSGSEVLELIIRAFLGEGLEYITTNPMFKPYQMFSDKMGAKMVDVPLLAPNYALNATGILAAINDQTRLIFLTSPNNPTGTHIPKPILDNFIAQLPNHVVLVLDEVYFHYAEAADYTTALPYVKAGKQVIALNSFSKTYGLAGLRLGYAYTTPELAEYVQRLYKPFQINTLGLEAAIAALSDTDFLERTVSLVKKERVVLYKNLDRLGIKYWQSQANFVMFKTEMEAKKLVELLQKEGIMVRPVAGFGAPGCIRVTIGTAEANIAFITALEKILSTSIK